jgi:peptidoglycan/xylan/chitin deacetylase (PgdA/CDA1 family)
VDWNCRLGQFVFPELVWRETASAIHLTFDDGPHSEATPRILQLLHRYGAKGTFFLLGENVRTFPQLARRIVLEGHAVGSHGFSHTRLLFRTNKFVLRELEQTNTEIQRATGIVPTMFRPPHGQFDWRVPSIAAAQGMRTILWSVSSKDYAGVSPTQIVDRLTSRVSGGDIVLMHDNRRTRDVLPSALEQFLQWGQEQKLKFDSLPS